MKRSNRGCIVFLLAGVLGAMGGTAWAQEAPAAPAAAPAEHKFTGDKQGFFMSGGVADGAFWALGTTFPSGLALSAGVDITYDGNGLTMGSTDKFAFSALLYGAYYVVNKFPVGIAPEVAVILPVAPTAGSPATIIQPGIGVFYAPFPVPLVFSSALDLQIVIPKTGSSSFKSVTPGLRLIYVFP